MFIHNDNGIREIEKERESKIRRKKTSGIGKRGRKKMEGRDQEMEV